MLRFMRVSIVATFIACLCTIGLVANSGPAQAVEAPTPEQITLGAAGVGMLGPSILGGAAAAEGGAAAGAAGAVCATGVGCAALLVVGVGLLGYATRDTWMPWVKNGLEGGGGVTLEGGTSLQFTGNWINVPQANTTYDISMPSRPAFRITNSTPGQRWSNYSITMRCKNFDQPDPGQNVMHEVSIGGQASINAVTDVYLDQCYSTGSTNPYQIEFVNVQVACGYSCTDYAFRNVLTWEAPTTPDVTTRLQCKRPDGSTYWREHTTPAAGDYLKVGHCDDGDTPVQIEVVGSNGDVQQRQPLTSTVDDVAYPLCAGTACFYAVHVDGKKCEVVGGVAIPSACHSWTTLARSTDPETRERTECWYGPYEVPIHLCYPLERIYESGTTTGTKANTDGLPGTYTPPAPGPAPTPSPSPTPSGSPSPLPSGVPSPGPSGPTDPNGAKCVSSYSLGPVQPEAVSVANNIGARYSVDTVYGYRDPNSDTMGEHSSGLALDFMVYGDFAKGQSIAAYLQANANTLGVHWVIWQQKVWNVERASEGWRAMEDRGSDTANHRDHVHVFLYDTDGENLSCTGDPVGDGAGGACLSRAASWNPVDWVYWPTRCVLTWAFVPRADVLQDDFGTVRASWDNSTPGKWSGALSGIPPALDLSGGTCEGPTMNLGPPLNVMVQPAWSCSGIRSTMATVSRTALGAGLVLAAAMTCIRLLASGLSYGGFRGGSE